MSPLSQLYCVFAANVVDTQIIVYRQSFGISISTFGIAVIIANTVAYAIFVRDIFSRGEFPPLSVWGLWLLLDGVITGAEFRRGIFNPQMVTYCIGTVVVFGMLLWKGPRVWDMVWDTLTAVLAILAIGAFIEATDPLWSEIFALMGLAVATWPFYVRLWNGLKEPITPWFFIVAASAFVLLDGKILSGLSMGFLQVLVVALIVRNAMARRRAVVV